jgi:acylphosphatase
MAFRVRGRVQGVGFRWFVQNSAAVHDLSGWVRNEADGTVSGEAQGSQARLASFREELLRGPRAAAVDAVDIAARPVQVDETEFRIR